MVVVGVERLEGEGREERKEAVRRRERGKKGGRALPCRRLRLRCSRRRRKRGRKGGRN